LPLETKFVMLNNVATELVLILACIVPTEEPLAFPEGLCEILFSADIVLFLLPLFTVYCRETSIEIKII